MFGNLKEKARNLGFWIGLLGVLYIFLSQFFIIDEEIWNQIILLTAAVFVEIGILTDTSGEHTPLTKESFLEKLKSPAVWAETATLLIYVATVAFGDNVGGIVNNAIGVAMALFFGFGVYNDPNSRDSL